MAMQVTVALRDDIYERAKWLAQLTGQDVSAILATTLEASLSSLESEPAKAVKEMSNAEVLLLAEGEMRPAQDRRLSFLLDKQRNAASLSDSVRAELQTLMQVYQIGILRKAQALAEAVRRGLRQPLTP